MGREQRVLVLCPHTDDEFGCAGTLLRLVDAGATIRYFGFSRCEESVPTGLPKDTLVHECYACTGSLGIPRANVTIGDFRVRHFPSVRQDILELLVKLRKEFEPTLVLCPSSYDTHQDHRVVFEEGFRAFKHSSILGYELPQNLISFNNSAFIRLDEELMQRKIEALTLYKSQGFRRYASEQFIRGLATVRGAQCNCDYAEAFEMIRLVL